MVEALRSRPISFVFCLTGSEPGPLEATAAALGCPIERVAWNARFPLGFCRVVKRYNVDTVHAHSATTSGALLFLAWLFGVPQRIAHFRSDGDGHQSSLRRRAQRTFMRLLIRVFATDVVGVSPGALVFAGAVSRSKRARVIPSGLRVEDLAPEIEREKLRLELAGDTRILITHIGRDRPEKNRPRAVEILAKCLDAGLDARLLIVGRYGASERAELEVLSKHLGLSPDALAFTGEREDVQRVLSVSDMCLVTSLREGLPGVVLEATAVGTPCVASALPGVRWVAGALPLVTPCELSQSNNVWVRTIKGALVDPGRPSRLVAKRHFEQSEFSMKSAERAFAQLWRVSS